MGKKNKLQHLKTVQRPYTGSDSARHSNCHRINFEGLNSVYPICLPAWHRLENSPVKSCISPPQKLCINSSNKTRKSFELYSAGEYSISSLTGQARHLRFFQRQWKTKSCISSLSLELVCVHQSLYIHITGLRALLPTFLKKGIFPESMYTRIPPDSFWSWAKKYGIGHNCPNYSRSVFSGTAGEHTERGLQAGWMVLVVATFNHHFPRAILSPSSVTLQILKFRGLQHCRLRIHNECNGNLHKSKWSQN